MNLRTLMVALLLVPGVSAADTFPDFAQLRDSATPITALGTFLDRYVGGCSDPLAGLSCRTKAEAFRKEVNGKKFYMIITEDQADMVSAGPYDMSRKVFTVNVVPFFAASGLALTQGAPKKTDENGNPILPFIPVQVELPVGWSAFEVSGLFRRRDIRLQVIFTPQEVWTLSTKKGKASGMKARIDAIMVSQGRTGRNLGMYPSR